jgi:osmoprotectant transport system permease protein
LARRGGLRLLLAAGAWFGVEAMCEHKRFDRYRFKGAPSKAFMRGAALLHPAACAVALLFLPLAAPAGHAQTEIAVGSKKFTESYILGEIAKTLLSQAGFQAVHREGIGGTIILWQALLHNDIQTYPEYTGTITEEILKSPVAMSPDAMRAALAELGIGMSASLGFNDSYTLVMRRAQAEALAIETISDLKRHPDLRAGPTPEFLGRQDGWAPLAARYGLTFASVRGIEHGLGYAALANGLIDVKEAYTTDARLAGNEFLALADDLHFFPQYQAVFLYRLDLPEKAIAVLRSLEGQIGETRMIALNSRAETAKNYAAAAEAFFKDRSGESAVPPTGTGRRHLLAALPRLTAQHLTLVAISLIAAILVSIPLGMAASRPGIVSELILGAAGVIQTIPSLALLAFMIPVFGIGQIPAIAALFLYSLLPIIRSTATGLMTIPASLRQAATALGLRPGTRLWYVDLPIASQSILSGIKTSAVINVGTATLAGLIGGGGYGEPIQSGLQLNDTPTILAGAIPAAILALTVQAAFSGLDRLLIPKGLRLKTGQHR